MVAASVKIDVAALLAAEAEVACARSASSTYRSPTAVVMHLDAGVAHRVVEAEVAHHGGHDGVVAQLAALVQRERADGQDLVAVDDLAGRVDGQAAVGVAVVRDAEVGAVLRTACDAAGRGGWSRRRR